LSLFCAVPQAARAQGFSVDPIRLELNPGQRATSLTVANYNAEVLVMQVRVYRWKHEDSKDVLSEIEGDEAPLITPPLFRLAPGGGSQVIRIGFQKHGDPPADEQQWRVIIEELPRAAGAAGGEAAPSAADATGAAAGAPISVAVHLRVSVPLLERPRNVRQDLRWTLQRGAPGSVTLTASNLGSVTERLDDVRLGSTDDAKAHFSGPLYLFPGERRSFELCPSVALPDGSVRLSVQGTPRPLMRELQLSAQ
jgi:fimbrial chaperone protein